MLKGTNQILTLNSTSNMTRRTQKSVRKKAPSKNAIEASKKATAPQTTEDAGADTAPQSSTAYTDTAQRARGKKLFAIGAVLLAFCGVLFVAYQNMTLRATLAPFASDARVVERFGSTFVRYPEPLIRATLVIDSSCDTCAEHTKALTDLLRHSVPTAVITDTIDLADPRTTNELTPHAITTVPSVIFDAAVENTHLYAQHAAAFTTVDDDVVFTPHTTLGVTPARYVSAPTTDDVFISGSADPRVTLHVFTALDCPLCATHSDIINIVAARGDDVQIVRHIARQTAQTDAAFAALTCADAQSASDTYISRLFLSRALWDESDDASDVFAMQARYAGIDDADAFATCIAQDADDTKMNRQNEHFERYGISTVPTTIVVIDDAIIPLTGVQIYETLSNVLETETE